MSPGSSIKAPARSYQVPADEREEGYDTDSASTVLFTPDETSRLEYRENTEPSEVIDTWLTVRVQSGSQKVSDSTFISNATLNGRSLIIVPLLSPTDEITFEIESGGLLYGSHQPVPDGGFETAFRGTLPNGFPRFGPLSNIHATRVHALSSAMMGSMPTDERQGPFPNDLNVTRFTVTVQYGEEGFEVFSKDLDTATKRSISNFSFPIDPKMPNVTAVIDFHRVERSQEQTSWQWDHSRTSTRFMKRKKL